MFESQQLFYTICDGTHVVPLVILPADFAYEPVKQVYLLGNAAFNESYTENVELHKMSRKTEPSKLNTSMLVIDKL